MSRERAGRRRRGTCAPRRAGRPVLAGIAEPLLEWGAGGGRRRGGRGSTAAQIPLVPASRRRGEEKAERAGTASFQIVSPPRPCAEAGGPGSSEAAGRGPATSWRSALLRLPAWKRGRAKFSPSAGACSASLSRVSRAAPLSPPPSGSGFSSSPWPPGRSVLSLPPSRHSGLFSPSLCAPLRFPYLFHFLSLALSSVPISFSQSSLVSLCISASVFPFFGVLRSEGGPVARVPPFLMFLDRD